MTNKYTEEMNKDIQMKKDKQIETEELAENPDRRPLDINEMFGDSVEQYSPTPLMKGATKRDVNKNLMSLTECEPKSNTDDQNSRSVSPKKKIRSRRSERHKEKLTVTKRSGKNKAQKDFNAGQKIEMALEEEEQTNQASFYKTKQLEYFEGGS